jgi:hypothetical protein
MTAFMFVIGFFICIYIFCFVTFALTLSSLDYSEVTGVADDLSATDPVRLVQSTRDVIPHHCKGNKLSKCNFPASLREKIIDPN